MFSLRRPAPDALARLVAEQRGHDLSYPEHGATAGVRPAGYHHDRWEADLGPFSQDRFDRLAEALRHWQIHQRSGMTVIPADPVRPGLTFALAFRLPAGYVTAAGRVVYVTSEPDCRGFAYGTLPGHPEQGEESFHVVREGPRLLFRVSAFSRPRHPLARLGGPASRAVQVMMNKRYLSAARDAAG